MRKTLGGFLMTEPSNVTPLRSVTWAAESGSRRDMLVALRDRLWVALHDERTQPRDLSPLCLRLKELQLEIEDLDARDDDDQSPPADEPFNPGEV